MKEPDPEKAMENYRQGLEMINSPEAYEELFHSGFHVILRNENRSISQTFAMAEEAFGLLTTKTARQNYKSERV